MLDKQSTPKHKGALDILLMLLLLIFYPVSAFFWYKGCKENKDEDSKKFFQIVVWGLITFIGGIILIIFNPIKNYNFPSILYLAPYYILFFKEIELASKKSIQRDREAREIKI